MFSGMVKGAGPMPRPSIEDEIVRFADKERHQLFLEPEGRDTEEVFIFRGFQRVSARRCSKRLSASY